MLPPYSGSKYKPNNPRCGNLKSCAPVKQSCKRARVLEGSGHSLFYVWVNSGRHVTAAYVDTALWDMDVTQFQNVRWDSPILTSMSASCNSSTGPRFDPGWGSEGSRILNRNPFRHSDRLYRCLVTDAVSTVQVSNVIRLLWIVSWKGL